MCQTQFNYKKQIFEGKTIVNAQSTCLGNYEADTSLV